MNKKLNLEFVKRAEQVTSFNLSAADFQTKEYKKEIQHLFNKHFFPKFDISKTIKTTPTKEALNSLIDSLKSESNSMFINVHAYNLKGIGPGEVTLFFLIDDSYLGGGSSAGIDIVIGGQPYEIKAIQVSGDGYYKDFKLGGTFSLGTVQSDIFNLAKRLKLGVSRASEIPTGIIKELQIKAPKEYEMIQDQFRDLAYNNYFKGKKMIFINNSKTRKLGQVENIMTVQKKQIFIERVTSNTIKPMVKF